MAREDPLQMRAHVPASWLLVLLLAIGAVGCGTVAADGDSGSPLDHMRQAVELASASGSFRVRGEVRASMPMVAWEGVVVGSDEQLTTHAGGLLIENRRIGGRSWGRRLDPTGPWAEVRYDGSIDLSVLLRGQLVQVEHTDGQWLLTLQFTGTDVLRALTHVPSVGPTTAHVTLIDGVLSEVTLDLAGHVTAHIGLWDFGAPLDIEPVALPPDRREDRTIGRGFRARGMLAELG